MPTHDYDLKYNIIVSYDISDSQNREKLRNFLKEECVNKVRGGIEESFFEYSVRKISESTYNIELKLRAFNKQPSGNIEKKSLTRFIMN